MYLSKKKILPQNDINKLIIPQKINHIYILGNGPSLNKIIPYQLKNKFLIGTNRTWLWGRTNILVWRDARISEELQFFNIVKNPDTLWIASHERYEYKTQIKNLNFVKNQIDYFFNDAWKNKVLRCNIRWNGIVFHAIAIAKFLSPNAKIHLIGVDLMIKPNKHHFFNHYKGFDRGFYKNNWNQESFNYQKRLDMMLKNFENLNKMGLKIINHSSESKLTEIYGYTKL